MRIPCPDFAHNFAPSILREYDIRGTFGKTLFEADAYALGRSFGAILGPRESIVVGRDGRLSSPVLEAALVHGLADAGVNVIRVGLGPTPMLYFAEASVPQVKGGIQVTGSHNPADHNGFKMVFAGAPFFGADITRLGSIAASGACPAAEHRGAVTHKHVLPAYVDRLIQGLAACDPSGLSRLRVGWDAGNGAAGPSLERLLAQLPGEHHLLYSEVDGRFPNHHPDPTIDANLADLRALVAAKNLDFGLAFDGDADRIGVIDSLGRVLDADQLLLLFARDVLARHPGARVIADVKASRTVFDGIDTLGGQAEMAPSGHSHIKARMKATGAALGGETSGHFFFADDWFGFDDGLYAAIRLIAAIVRIGASVTALRDAIPALFKTPELRFPADDLRKFQVVEETAKRLKHAGAQMTEIDGVRVSTPDGWWLLRASNTEAALTARAESDTPEGLQRLLAQIDDHLAASGLVKSAGR
ncbi:phosphoglucomutase/phosphomannomutase PgmG [Novosphingobium guangzhouense]|uniref:Phosphomannomutase n=1 Tax=Novosphingobium guangzhouense TaxID=1850347 RepID=A0A2K2FY09_9SPHN|nr:phosphomannomutase/phosphoglucomutase [Novosphingobium guangzhouense]PNU03689.1 phosphomannomutase [Novosphingobium guangzhouense]